MNTMWALRPSRVEKSERDERGEKRRESSYFHRYDNTLPCLKSQNPRPISLDSINLRHSHPVFRFRLRNCGSQSIQFSSPFRVFRVSIQVSTMLGGKTEVPAAANDLEVEELANYAVNEHNNQQVCPLGRWGCLVFFLKKKKKKSSMRFLCATFFHSSSLSFWCCFIN